MEWLAVGRVDFCLVYSSTASPAVELQLLRDEQMYLVAARTGRQRDRLVGPVVGLAQVAQAELVIPARPHSIRMLLDSALADAGLKARVALEIESVPTLLDLVQHDGFHAVLTLNAIRRSGSEDAFYVRPIGKPRLKTTLRLATSAQRPAGPLMEQTIALVKALVALHWA